MGPAHVDVIGAHRVGEVSGVDGGRRGVDPIGELVDPGPAGGGRTFRHSEPDDMRGILAEAAALVADGTIAVPIARTYPLADAPAAHRESQTGHVRGKLVLAPEHLGCPGNDRR